MGTVRVFYNNHTSGTYFIYDTVYLEELFTGAQADLVVIHSDFTNLQMHAWNGLDRCGQFCKGNIDALIHVCLNDHVSFSHLSGQPAAPTAAGGYTLFSFDRPIQDGL
jgi:hypothetical protein